MHRRACSIGNETHEWAPLSVGRTRVAPDLGVSKAFDQHGGPRRTVHTLRSRPDRAKLPPSPSGTLRVLRKGWRGVAPVTRSSGPAIRGPLGGGDRRPDEAGARPATAESCDSDQVEPCARSVSARAPSRSRRISILVLTDALYAPYDSTA